jgi:hypothetical protein
LRRSGLAGYHQRAKARAGGEGTEEAHQVDSRWRDEGGQAAKEGGGGEEELGGAGRGGALHPVAEPSVREEGEALQGEGASGAVVAQPLQALAVVASSRPAWARR